MNSVEQPLKMLNSGRSIMTVYVHFKFNDSEYLGLTPNNILNLSIPEETLSARQVIRIYYIFDIGF